MEAAVALALALLSVPFLLPIISWLIARKTRARVEDLEAKLARQEERLDALTLQFKKLKESAFAPPTAEELRRDKPAAAVSGAPPPVKVAEPIAEPKPVVPPPAAVAPPPPPPRFEPKSIVPPPPPRIEAKPAAPPPPRPPVTPPPPPIDPPPPPEPPAPAWSFDLERFVGVRLFSAVAGIALVFAAVFFLRYSIDQGWLQPPVRVAIGVIVAVVLLVVCDRQAARKYALLANAMDAAAIAILFATFFAAHSVWKLIPASMAFGLLALVTLTAVLLSIRHESLFIAVLGLLGGFSTPILLSTGENRPIPLFAYLLLLNIGLAWVAYRNGWTILSILTLVFTTLYQWGWVARYLDVAQVPLAIGIFTIFPIVGYGVLMAARARQKSTDPDAESRFEYTLLAASLLPAAFAVYLAISSEFSSHYRLLFGWVFLIDIALLALALARGYEALHAFGALTTLLVVVMWTSAAYLPGAMLPLLGFVALFVVFFLAAPAIAGRFDQEFEDAGAHAIVASPLLLTVFPVLVSQEKQAASPALVFLPLFGLILPIVWRSFSESTGRLYFIAAFFALATEAAWSARYLTPETLWPAMAVYAAFAFLYLGVPMIARSRGTPLKPAAAPGIVLLLGLLLLIVFADRRVAAEGLWGLALLLAILNAALFIESASASLPILSLAGSLISWVVLFTWWEQAAASVGLLSSLLVVVGLSLVMVGGYIWGLRYAPQEATSEVRSGANGLWLALLGHLFLFGVAANFAWAVPPWPLFGALAVVTLAFSTAALAARNAPIHVASVVMTALILAVWRGVTQQAGYATTGIAAFGALMAFSLLWIAVDKRSRQTTAIAALVVIVISELSLMAMMAVPSAAPLPITLGAHVVSVSIMLALVRRQEWDYGASAVAVLGGLAAGSVLLPPDPAGRDVLIFAAAVYSPFALYPFVLGSRARDDRDPYIAALVAAAWCFLIARRGMTLASLDWMVGIVPVLIGAVTTLHLSQLLRIQPRGERDLGRLALVAGAALAFLTVAIPLQLRHQWITIGWALEGAAIAWLYTRIPHRGLLLFCVGLLGAVFARLAMNPDVFLYEPRGDTRILNWYLYTYVIAAAALLAAAWYLKRTDDEIAEALPRPRHVFPAAAGVLLFLLLNIEIADYYSTGPEILFRFGSSIQQDLTYTIAWLIFGILTLAVGIIARVRPARVTAVTLIAITAFKCFLYDLGSLGGLYRVGAFVGLAVSLALVSLVLQKYVLAPEKEPAL
jgi:uncharacterized membrane protein